MFEQFHWCHNNIFDLEIMLSSDTLHAVGNEKNGEGKGGKKREGEKGRGKKRKGLDTKSIARRRKN